MKEDNCSKALKRDKAIMKIALMELEIKSLKKIHKLENMDIALYWLKKMRKEKDAFKRKKQVV